MNITLKKLFLIITASLVGLAFASSCSKEPSKQPVIKSASKKGKAFAEPKAKIIPSDEKNTFTAVRSGQHVNLNWRFDKAALAGGKIKQISIRRNSTGTNKQQQKVAELGPDAVTFQDSLPDAYAHWYWIKIIMANGTIWELGPAKVGPDKAGSSGYTRQEDKYKASVTRTDEIAALKWDFPEDEYVSIYVVRNTRPTPPPFLHPAVRVATTLAGKSQATDALPDANLDYWYWFQITLPSGAIIYKGPIKAEYARR